MISVFDTVENISKKKKREKGPVTTMFSISKAFFFQVIKTWDQICVGGMLCKKRGLKVQKAVN